MLKTNFLFCNVEEVCALPSDSGNCYARNERFYFDSASKECKEFIYGGCGGNANNFSSSDECKKTCL